MVRSERHIKHRSKETEGPGIRFGTKQKEGSHIAQLKMAVLLSLLLLRIRGSQRQLAAAIRTAKTIATLMTEHLLGGACALDVANTKSCHTGWVEWNAGNALISIETCGAQALLFSMLCLLTTH